MESMASRSARRGIEREGWIRVESKGAERRARHSSGGWRDTREKIRSRLAATGCRTSGAPAPFAATRECREIFVGRVDTTRQSGPRPFREWTRAVLPSNVVGLLRFATHDRRDFERPPSARKLAFLRNESSKFEGGEEEKFSVSKMKSLLISSSISKMNQEFDEESTISYYWIG